ncbi:MAG: DUF4157 domain-containing protein [Defluviitaleaceae bacterium]|nr:DUF4157 domain-containing protein [Defluviitaleaceae bacterium]
MLESPEVAKMGAQATAQGNIIRFAPGQYNPNTIEGRRVLGHELNHVREQAQGKIKPNVEGTNIHFDPVNEAASDRAGEEFANGMLNDVAPVSIGQACVDMEAVQGIFPIGPIMPPIGPVVELGQQAGNWVADRRTERQERRSEANRTRADQVVMDNAEYILNAASHFDINPAILASAIQAEHYLNVDWVDSLTDNIGGFYGLNTSIGVAQVRVNTARRMEEAGLMPEITRYHGGWNLPFGGFLHGTETMARSVALQDPQTNTMYAAALMRYYTDRWESEYPGIANSPGVLATLFNQGELNPPHCSPVPNSFGEHAYMNYLRMYGLLDLERDSSSSFGAVSNAAPAALVGAVPTALAGAAPTTLASTASAALAGVAPAALAGVAPATLAGAAIGRSQLIRGH